MRTVLTFLLLIVLLVGGSLVFALYVPYRGFSKEGAFVDIPRGASGKTIARLLKQGGVIRSRLAFEGLSRWHSGRPLQAGEYFFDRPVTSVRVFETLAEGRVYTKELIVPEGLTMFDIADLLEREGFLARQTFLDAACDPTPIHDLAPNAVSLEGFLFPATYKFPRHPSAKDVVAAMTQRFREAWQALPEASRSRNPRPLEAVVTLASLVERETPVPTERPMVAGVFTNRLRRGMSLQCDPTVIYALQQAGRYNGALNPRDLSFNSPYNTYLHPSLPPGPIGNPGEASLRAALDPPEVDYLYFVANTRGGHFFSKTLQEHNQNVTRYRHLLNQNAQRQNSEKSSEVPRERPR